MKNKILVNLLQSQIFVWLFVFIFYFFIAIFFTYPLIWNMNTLFIGRGGWDGFVYAWNVFIFWQNILNLQNPFFTNQIFYPVGANLVFQDYAPLISLFGFPFLNNIIFYLNSVIIFGLTLSGLSAFILASYLIKDNRISFLVGCLYAFSPTMTSYLLVQHYYYAFGPVFLPLGVLMTFKLVDKGIKYLKFICLFFWLAFFTNYYLAVLYVFMVTTVFISLLITRYSYGVINHLNRNLFLSFFKRIIIFILIPLIIFIILFVQPWNYNQAFLTINNDINCCNSNLMGFVIPAQENVFLADISNKLYNHFGLKPHNDTRSYYLGGIFILITLFSLVYFRRNKYILSLGITGIIVGFYSLGLQVKIGEAIFLSGPGTLYFWLSKLPFLGLVDYSMRFPIGMHLVIAVIVGFFAATIYTKSKKIGIVILILLFTVFLIDFNRSGIVFTPVTVPSVYRQIATYPDNKTVLDISTGLSESKGSFGTDYLLGDVHSPQMYWQTIYKKPRVGGYISRIPLQTYHFFESEPVISDIFKLTDRESEWTGVVYTKSEVEAFLQKFNIGYIVIPPSERQHAYYAKLKELLTGIIYQETWIENYILLKI